VGGGLRQDILLWPDHSVYFIRGVCERRCTSTSLAHIFAKRGGGEAICVRAGRYGGEERFFPSRVHFFMQLFYLVWMGVRVGWGASGPLNLLTSTVSVINCIELRTIAANVWYMYATPI
jgi:hypothetical protein